jgi:hypothetical protein
MADSTFAKVAEYLSAHMARNKGSLTITRETAVYQDLGLYGDDVFELVVWLHREFGVQTNFTFGVYAPGESFSPLSLAIRLVRRLLGNTPTYERLTVRAILAAIEAKRWPQRA